MPYAEFEHSRSGETLDRLQKLRTKVEQLIGNAFNVLFVSLLGVVVVLAYAATVYWVIALYLAVVTVLMIALSVARSRTLKRIYEDVFREGTTLAGAATEALRNIELVKSLGLAQREISRLHAEFWRSNWKASAACAGSASITAAAFRSCACR